MSVSTKSKNKYIIVILLITTALVLVLTNIPGVFKLMYPLDYKEYVVKYSNQYNVDPYLVFSMIKAESNFDEKAVSHKNARGLMQITDDTGKWIAQKLKIEGFKVDDLYDPDLNIRFGCWYINYLTEKLAGTRENEDYFNLVVLSYNGGMTNVKTWLRESGKNGSELAYDDIPFKETRNYLKKVKDFNNMYKRLYEKII